MKTFKDFKKELAGNLNISRKNMPQVSSDAMPDFFDFMKEQGVKYSNKKILVSKLTATQNEVSNKAIEKLMQDKPPKLKKPVMISRDNYVLDGHHRWLAQFGLDPKCEIAVTMIDLPVRKALALIKKFPKTYHTDKPATGFDPNYYKPA